ncbi:MULTISPECIES: ribosome assembly RNA-binding protein YhbY [Lactococcus]|uniref:ribosome assembly RNA-binding protein YhbY n=1 Tax=Lactococcus TaxID=1357 RepID=UPI00071CCADD|nr:MULTISPECIES: ribosome assembly RNA-binding protein YhbY [Lactococcus]KAF6610522.1 ribosome assembly RNA-binding protein YhbY [Lactococcus sp. EKM201L]KAF6613231.1 ribosome assembly RNA-binding protein YhbY [Lactococcus sp. EKM203L]KAF6644124.1 ribosome assembly RNA-binding protein YhbY [Lactococcus sp. EKM501L]KAF6647807.1 ribosome assembly RNA-binding protein YhbY [Lactococcus sp. EKM502L]KAF6653360.1 ribosome assembly RNA-binding protein YhbY [Lactococcus sp. EKM101L]
MEMNGKQKRYLRSLAVNIKPIVQIGKSGLSNEILTSIRNAADARELIKVNILQNSDEVATDVAEAIEEMGLDVVQIIGRNLIVFKVSDRKENRKISVEVKNIGK